MRLSARFYDSWKCANIYKKSSAKGAVQFPFFLFQIADSNEETMNAIVDVVFVNHQRFGFLNIPWPELFETEERLLAFSGVKIVTCY